MSKVNVENQVRTEAIDEVAMAIVNFNHTSEELMNEVNSALNYIQDNATFEGEQAEEATASIKQAIKIMNTLSEKLERFRAICMKVSSIVTADSIRAKREAQNVQDTLHAADAKAKVIGKK